MTIDSPPRPPYLLGSLITLFGVIGLYAAFDLTLEKFNALAGSTRASCDFGIVFQCSSNLKSAQGALFGFPNPVIGLICWSIVIAVGVGLLAGASYAAWYWIGFNVGIVGALVFIIWLMSQSIFVLGTLCLYCMITWAVVIPLFWVVTLHNLRAGHIRTTPRLQGFAAAAFGWIPLITLVCYLVVAVIAQLRLEWLGYLLL